MNGLDIASFAESLINEEANNGKPVQFQAAQAPNAPDVSEVDVPVDFADQILLEGGWKSNEISSELSPRSKTITESEQYKKQLLTDYEEKLLELEDLIQEMTTVGMIGAGVGPGVGAGPAAPGLSVSKRKKKKKKNVNDRLTKFSRRG